MSFSGTLERRSGPQTCAVTPLATCPSPVTRGHRPLWPAALTEDQMSYRCLGQGRWPMVGDCRATPGAGLILARPRIQVDRVPAVIVGGRHQRRLPVHAVACGTAREGAAGQHPAAGQVAGARRTASRRTGTRRTGTRMTAAGETNARKTAGRKTAAGETGD